MRDGWSPVAIAGLVLVVVGIVAASMPLMKGKVGVNPIAPIAGFNPIAPIDLAPSTPRLLLRPGRPTLCPCRLFNRSKSLWFAVKLGCR